MGGQKKKMLFMKKNCSLTPGLVSEMKTKLSYIAWILLLAVSCTKDAEIKPKDYPFVVTQAVGLTEEGATFTAEILDIGNNNISSYGFIWSGTSSLGNDFEREILITDPPAISTYSAKITTGLTKGEYYYVKAFVKTNSFLVYGNQLSFQSSGCLQPQITGFNPAFGPIGTPVEITGKNFSTYIEDNYISFGVATAVIDSVFEDRIYVRVPKVIKTNKVQIILVTAGMTIKSEQLFEIWFPWTEKSNFTGIPTSYPVGFSINGMGYVCLGSTGYGSPINNLWEYNPQSDIWTEKTGFPGSPRSKAAAFVIGNKAYVGLGSDFSEDELSDFWAYDPGNDTWTRIADYPGTWKYFATTFSVGDKGYIGPGVDWDGFNYLYPKDLWEYNPATNLWARKADFPGSDRTNAYGFSAGNFGYVGMGSADVEQRMIYRYDPVSDSWEEAGYYPGKGYDDIRGFTLNGKAYFGFGKDQLGYRYGDFWEFDPNGNVLTEMHSCPVNFDPSIGFATGDRGYMCIGREQQSGYPIKVYEFDPAKN
jgi:N-acetylneuraminic acid mutarotase